MDVDFIFIFLEGKQGWVFLFRFPNSSSSHEK